MDCLDAINDHCQNIATVAGLLAAVDQHPDSDQLDPQLASFTGFLILEELKQARARLRELAQAWRT